MNVRFLRRSQTSALAGYADASGSSSEPRQMCRDAIADLVAPVLLAIAICGGAGSDRAASRVPLGSLAHGPSSWHREKWRVDPLQYADAPWPRAGYLFPSVDRVDSVDGRERDNVAPGGAGNGAYDHRADHRGRGGRGESSRERFQGLRVDVYGGVQHRKSGRAGSSTEPLELYGRSGSLREPSGGGAKQLHDGMERVDTSLWKPSIAECWPELYQRTAAGELLVQDDSGWVAADQWDLDLCLPWRQWLRLHMLELVRWVPRSNRERSDGSRRSVGRIVGGEWRNERYHARPDGHRYQSLNDSFRNSAFVARVAGGRAGGRVAPHGLSQC